MPPAEVAAARSGEQVARLTLETDDLVAGVNREAAETIKARSKVDPLDASFEEMEKYKPLDFGKVLMWNERIGSNFNPDTGAVERDPDEEIRYNRASLTSQAIVKLTQRGIDTLGPDEFAVVQGAVDAAIDTWREARLLTPAERLAARDRILRNPLLMLKARDAFREFIENDKNQIGEPDQVSQARLAYRQVQIEMRQREDRQTALQMQLRIVPVVDWLPGGRLERVLNGLDVADATRTVNILNANVVTAREQINDLSSQINSYARSGRPIPLGLEDQVRTLREFIREALNLNIPAQQAIIDRARELTAERDRVMSRTAELTNQLTTVQNEVELFRPRLEESLRVLNLASRVRAPEEEGYVNKLKQILVEAAKKANAETGRKYQKGQKEVVEETQKAEIDPAGQSLDIAITNRWKQRSFRRNLGIPFWRREMNRYDRRQIDDDFQLLMRRGPRELIEQIFRGNPPAIPPVPVLARQKFYADRNAWEKYQNLILSKLLKTYWERNRLSENDARRILESDWGSGLVTVAEQEDERVAQGLADLRAKNKTKGPIKEWFSKKTNQDLGRRALALAIGLPVAAGVVGTVGPPLATVGSAAATAGFDAAKGAALSAYGAAQAGVVSAETYLGEKAAQIAGALSPAVASSSGSASSVASGAGTAAKAALGKLP